MDWARQFWTLVFTPGTLGGVVHVYQARTILRPDRSTIDKAFFELPAIKVYGEYTVKHSFDLRLDNMLSRTENASTWIETIRNLPCIGNLSTTIDLGVLPATLNDIRSLYERHRQVANSTGLKRIRASRIQHFTLDDFRAFALVAGSSLTSLSLADSSKDCQKHITFAQLPTIVGLIQDHMPRLRHFTIGVTGWESSESICRDLLSEDLRSGTLRHLHLAGTPKDHPYFNAIRYLSRICCPGGKIYMGCPPIQRYTGPASGSWKYNEETTFREYIRRQPSDRQRHLVTVNFEDLEVTTLQDVLDLRYDDEGRPLRRKLYKAELWAAKGETVIDQALNGCEALVGRLAGYKEAVRAFVISDAADDRKATIKAGRHLQQAIQEVRRAQEEISRVVDKSVEKALESYLTALMSL